MELVITADNLIRVAAVLAALGGIGSAALWCVRFVQRQKRQDRELAAMREEQQMICYGLLACLDGLMQLGANHGVTKAHGEMRKHLNQAAHKGEVL